MSIYVGCCGFCIARSKYYSELPVVELQETFYNPPNLEKLRKYREEAPHNFIFTLKAWQAITHPLNSPTWRKAKYVPSTTLSDRYGFLRPTKEVFEAWEKIVEAVKILKAKVVVIQTPPSFEYTDENHRNAINFFSTVHTNLFTIAWEPRGSWLQKLDYVIDIVSRFKNIVHVVDPLKTTPVVEKSTTYFRLHGLSKNNEINYNYQYNDNDLKKLQTIIKKISENTKEIYVMFNNIYMAQDSLKFKHIISSTTKS